MYDSELDTFLPEPCVWKAVKGYEGSYKVNNYGQVLSEERVVYYEKADGIQRSMRVKARILKPKIDKDGYEEYALSLDGAKGYFRGHRLVAEAFLGNDNPDLVVDHKDAVKRNNHFRNLQWVTNTENTIKHYSQEIDNDKGLASLTYYDWRYVGFLYESGMSYKAISLNLGLKLAQDYNLWEGLSGRKLSSVTGFTKDSFKKRSSLSNISCDSHVINILKARLLDKLTLKEISEKFDVSNSTIARLVSGERRPEVREKFREDYGI